jgi:hypothetical protein
VIFKDTYEYKKEDPWEFQHLIQRRIKENMNPSEKLIQETRNFGYNTAMKRYRQTFKDETPYIK